MSKEFSQCCENCVIEENLRGCKMKKSDCIKKIESKGIYTKVKIDVDNVITGNFTDEDYRYDKNTNTGGRRFIGRFDNKMDMHYLLGGENE